MKDWTVADLDPKKLEELHKLERELGVVLIAWTPATKS